MTKALTLKSLTTALALAISVSGVNYAKAKQVDPELIQALQQATHDVQEQTTDLDALLWLSSMSERLEKRLPNPFYRIRLLETIYTEATLAGLDPQLVLAIIDIESNFDRFAVSRSGAQGLMQVMPFWKDVYQKPYDDLFNPSISLRYGCTILRHYLDKYSSKAEALAAYNGSLGRAVYPNKVLQRLNKHWRFEGDRYTKKVANKVAAR